VTDAENEKARVTIAVAVSEAYAKNVPMGEYIINKLKAYGFEIRKVKK
jgi:outer membrane usher protein FimD/PapC